MNKGNVIEIRCKKCNKLMMEYFVCGDDSAVALQNIGIKCDRCKRVMILKKYSVFMILVSSCVFFCAVKVIRLVRFQGRQGGFMSSKAQTREKDYERGLRIAEKSMIDRINDLGVTIFDLGTMSARYNNYAIEC